MRHFCLADGPDLTDLLLLCSPSPSQLLHDLLIELRVKKLPEDHLFIIRFCPEQLHKFSLSDHRHLHELILRQACDLLQLTVCLFLGILSPIGHSQRNRFTLFLHSASSFQRTDMPRDTADSVFLPVFPCSFGKGQFYKRLHTIVHELALQFRPVLFVGA